MKISSVFGTCQLRAAALLSLAVLVLAALPGSARAEAAPGPRTVPMKFSWVACEPNCGGWVSAVGIITADTPKDFENFARGRDLDGATVVLDSSGGSVNDAITLGRRFRKLGMLTTVGSTDVIHTPHGDRTIVSPDAYCESMCVYLLLAGKTRYVPPGAHVRVHQIWMGDRADHPRQASYTAQDLTIVERDLGRLANYTFDMGGAGDLLLLSLQVPPWKNLHQLTPAELQQTRVATTESAADVFPRAHPSIPVAALKPKAQDRLVSRTTLGSATSAMSKTAEATAPRSSVARAEPPK